MTWEKKLAIAASIVTIAAFFGLSFDKADEDNPSETEICKSVVTSTGSSTSCSSSQ